MHSEDSLPLSQQFRESAYFKDTIRPDGAFLYATLRRIALREALPADVRATLGRGCIAACVTIPALSAQVGRSKNTVRAKLQVLEDAGWIQRKERIGLPSAYVLADSSGYFADKVMLAMGEGPVCSDGTPPKIGGVARKEATPKRKRGRKKGVRKLSGSCGASCAEAEDYGVCGSFPEALAVSDPSKNWRGGENNNIGRYIASLDTNNSSPLFVHATPPKIGGVQNPLEKRKRGWEKLPVDRWGHTTLWAMISDRLLETGIAPLTLDTKSRASMRSLAKTYPMDELQRVGEFFAEHYRELRNVYDWRGSPRGGLFAGWYTTIREHADGRAITKRGAKESKERGSQSMDEIPRIRKFKGSKHATP